MLIVHCTLVWCLSLHKQTSYIMKLLTILITQILYSPYFIYRFCLESQDEISHDEESEGSSSDEVRNTMLGESANKE